MMLTKYNTLQVSGETAIYVPMIKRGVVDFALGADWTPATGDVKIKVGTASPANITNLPTAITFGNTSYWEFVLTAAETTCKIAVITVADSATKAVEDQSFEVRTFGHASAYFQADLSAANLPANVTQLLGTAWLTPGTAGTPDVNTKTLTAGAIAAASFAANALDAVWSTTARTLSSAGVAAIWDALVSSITTANSIGKRIIDYLTGDAYARIGAAGAGLTALGDTRLANLDVAISVIQSQITALNNLSAKANWFGYPMLEVPDSGTRPYVFELTIKDDEDKLVNLDSLPTIALTNAAGTDRSALITTTVANPSTGRYTITITVGTATVNESLKLTATGTIGADTRYASYGTQVVDYDTATLINQILTTLGTAGAGLTNLGDARIGTINTNASTAATQATAGAASAAAAVTAIAGVQSDTNDIQSRLPAALESGRIAAALDSAARVKLDATQPDYVPATAVSLAAAKTILDKIDSGLVIDGLVYQFTANMLELAPAGGSGSADWTADERAAIRAILGIPSSGSTPADPTTGVLDTIRDLVVAYIAAALATVNGTSGTIVGFPTTLNIGDSYTDDCNSAIHVFIRDENDDPITAVGTHDFTDGDFAPECIITQNGNTGRVKCEVAYVAASPENYLKIQIPSKESRRATPGIATAQVLLKWDGAQKALSKQTVTWEGLI